MNSILTALFVAGCIAGIGAVLVRSNNTIPSNFGAILLASGALLGVGLMASLAVGMLIIIIQTISGTA